MKSPRTCTGGAALILCVLVVFGLGISPVSASNGAGHTGNVSAVHALGAGHHFARNETHIQDRPAFFGNATLNRTPVWNSPAIKQNGTAMEHQFRNMTANRTAFKGNATFNKSSGHVPDFHRGGLGNFTANPSFEKRSGNVPVNATAQAEHLQSVVAGLEKQGVDVSALQTAISENDTVSIQSWFASYFEAHPAALPNATRSHGHMGNITTRGPV